METTSLLAAASKDAATYKTECAAVWWRIENLRSCMWQLERHRDVAPRGEKGVLWDALCAIRRHEHELTYALVGSFHEVFSSAEQRDLTPMGPMLSTYDGVATVEGGDLILRIDGKAIRVFATEPDFRGGRVLEPGTTGVPVERWHLSNEDASKMLMALSYCGAELAVAMLRPPKWVAFHWLEIK